jgi:hypothetical protein
LTAASSRRERSKEEDKEDKQKNEKVDGDVNVPYDKKSSKKPASLHKNILNKLGPGIITGASDADPSGIATYSQAGAQFGFGMAWLVLVLYPMMTVVQEY